MKKRRGFAPKSFLEKGLRGFTLIEILVVAGITAMLSSFFIFYSSTSRQQIALSVEKAKIAQVIGRARSLAISTYLQVPSTCGYGVLFNYAQSSFSLIRYEDPVCQNATPGTTVILETFPLSSSVVFGTGAARIGKVVFIPPDPKIYFTDSSGVAIPGTSANIYISTKSGSSAATITVGFGGQVSF